MSEIHSPKTKSKGTSTTQDKNNDDPLKTELLDKLKAQRKQLVKQFLQLSDDLADGPIETRSTTDLTCLLFLFIFVCSFFAMSGYSITSYKSLAASGQANLNPLYIEAWLGWIFLCLLLSLVLSYLYIFLFVYFPNQMMYTMIVVTELMLMAGAVCAVGYGRMIVFLVLLILVFLYAIVVYCFFQSARTGIAVVALAAKFVKQTLVPILILPLIILFFLIGLTLLHTYALASTYSILQYNRDNNLNSTPQGFFIAIYIIFWLFFVFFFYYLMTYAIGYCYALWFYQRKITLARLGQGLGWMARQIGTFVFGAVTLVVFTLGRLLSYSEPKDSSKSKAGSAVEQCIVGCLTKQLQQAIQYLNHYAIILASLTGSPYIECSQLAYGLLSAYPSLKYYSSTISKFIYIWGVIYTVIAPTVGAYFTMYDRMATLTVAVESWMISCIVFQVLVEGVAAAVVFVGVDDAEGRKAKGEGKGKGKGKNGKGESKEDEMKKGKGKGKGEKDGEKSDEEKSDGEKSDKEKSDREKVEQAKDKVKGKDKDKDKNEGKLKEEKGKEEKEKSKIEYQGEEIQEKKEDAEVGLEVLNKNKRGFLVKELIQELDKYSNQQNKEKIEKQLSSNKDSELQDLNKKSPKASKSKKSSKSSKGSKKSKSNDSNSDSDGKASDKQDSQRPIKAGDLIKAQAKQFATDVKDMGEGIDKFAAKH